MLRSLSICIISISASFRKALVAASGLSISSGIEPGECWCEIFNLASIYALFPNFGPV